MTRRRALLFLLALLSAHLLLPQASLATQAHGEPEGILAHQLAHLFFIVSMGVLIYWLRERRLVVDKAWRWIQYSALFFILWNVDTFIAHLLDEQLRLVKVTRIGLWDIHIDTKGAPPWLGWLYYILKLDHLLCVPALAFLLGGLRRVVRTGDLGSGRRRAS